MGDSFKSKFLEKELLSDIKQGMSSLGQDMITNKMAEHAVLEQSLAEGAFGSVLEAFLYRIKKYNMGVRYLSQETGIRRKVLKQMLDGEIGLTQDAMVKLIAAFEKRDPSMLSPTKPVSRRRM
jgi:hypothetical protein